MAEATLLCWESPAASELNLVKIIEFMGGDARVLSLNSEMGPGAAALERVIPAGKPILISASTLARLEGKDQTAAALLQSICTRACNVLIHGFQPGPIHSRLLRDLSSNSLVGVESLLDSTLRIHVTSRLRAASGSLSGIEFDSPSSEIPLTFAETAEQGSWEPIISLNQRPAFVHGSNAFSRVMLLASSSMPDLDQRIPSSRTLMQFFDSLIPVLIFLRGSAPDEFWRNDNPGACFIVDDPLLRSRYGFLDYQKLLELMEQKKFSTSIAFIPWNFRKSEPHVARLLATHSNAYSLSVHGCDHTRGEFGSQEPLVLRQRAQQALEWMRVHRELSGVEFDDVMVFPQGIFSSSALQALELSGYLAAVNSTPYPVDATEELTVRDLLQVAVTRFSQLPLFTRRYPQRLAELALDLFLGKPALVVEHHGFFRDGYGALAAAVERLYEMEPRLRWSSLGAVCSSSCLKKRSAGGQTQVRFFTNRFSLRNESDCAQDYVLSRPAPACSEDPAVLVNECPVGSEREGRDVQFNLSLAPGQAAEIKLAFGQPAPLQSLDRSAMHRAKVYLRRSLSEFRDNYLDMNSVLSRMSRYRPY